MASVKLPSNVSSITVSGTTHTPSGGRITPTTDALATALNHWDSRPKLRKTAANGDTTIVLPSVVSSITIGGTVYTPNAQSEITVPAAVATAFLHETKYTP
jgi:hypothetical protein